MTNFPTKTKLRPTSFTRAPVRLATQRRGSRQNVSGTTTPEACPIDANTVVLHGQVDGVPNAQTHPQLGALSVGQRVTHRLLHHAQHMLSHVAALHPLRLLDPLGKAEPNRTATRTSQGLTGTSTLFDQFGGGPLGRSGPNQDLF